MIGDRRPGGLDVGHSRRRAGAFMAAMSLGACMACPSARAQGAGAPAPTVTVAAPLARTLAVPTEFLGQFSAVDTVALRAQVGGTLTAIHFSDGQLVHKGDLLFEIDDRPYRIRVAQAVATLRGAQARVSLATQELWRAKRLRQDDFGSQQVVDQRQADLDAAQATLAGAEAAVRDAQLDFDYCRITAPFTGRIGAHQMSVGALISGSRTGGAANTLLASLVSIDPIHVDFDMSEADYVTYEHARAQANSKVPEVAIALGESRDFTLRGRLDFIDNQVDRASGTIRARATLANADGAFTPGEFARVRLPLAPAAAALLVPDAAVMSDQSQQIVMTVDDQGAVVPKPVATGAVTQGLRVVTAGLDPHDRVIIGGLMLVRPGAKVKAVPGAIHTDAPA